MGASAGDVVEAPGVGVDVCSEAAREASGVAVWPAALRAEERVRLEGGMSISTMTNSWEEKRWKGRRCEIGRWREHEIAETPSSDSSVES